MKQISICILSIIGLFLLTCSNVNEIKKTDLSADSRWEEVDSLEKKGLYKSAWEIVNEIFSDAQKEKDFQLQYKALCYQLKYSRFIDEGGHSRYRSECAYVPLVDCPNFPPVLLSFLQDGFWPGQAAC